MNIAFWVRNRNDPRRRSFGGSMNHHLFRSSALAAAAFVALAASPAAAQDEEAEEGGWILSLGAGGRVGPKYPGADTYGFGPMPIFGLRREGAPLPFEAPDEGSG